MKSFRTTLHVALAVVALMAATAHAAPPPDPSGSMLAFASVERSDAVAISAQLGGRADSQAKVEHPLRLYDPGTAPLAMPWPTQLGLCQDVGERNGAGDDLSQAVRVARTAAGRAKATMRHRSTSDYPRGLEWLRT